MKMLMQHLHAQPVPPSERTELPVPRELDELILACLQKDPKLRPQDAGELYQMACQCRIRDEWSSDEAETLVAGPPAAADRPADGQHEPAISDTAELATM